MNSDKDIFNIGDTVRLKSGGPLMTVVNNNVISSNQLVECSWFDDNDKLIKDTFNYLTLIEDDDEYEV